MAPSPHFGPFGSAMQVVCPPGRPCVISVLAIPRAVVGSTVTGSAGRPCSRRSPRPTPWSPDPRRPTRCKQALDGLQEEDAARPPLHTGSVRAVHGQMRQHPRRCDRVVPSGVGLRAAQRPLVGGAASGTLWWQSGRAPSTSTAWSPEPHDISHAPVASSLPAAHAEGVQIGLVSLRMAKPLTAMVHAP